MNFGRNLAFWTNEKCIFGRHISSVPIYRSIIQGSGIGPSLYIIYADDLRALSPRNVILKYADDTYILVPQDSSVSLESELMHVQHWSVNNKLMLNTAKTKEIVFRRPRARSSESPSLLPNIERVDHINILGVTVTNHFSVAAYVNNLIAVCNQRLFLISKLKSQGLAPALAEQVFQALVMSKISYALPAVAGLFTSSDKSRLDVFFRKAVRRKISSQEISIDNIISRADYILFTQIKYDHHCLHHLLPPIRQAVTHHPGRARSRGHNYCLPFVSYDAFRNSFIIRMLYGQM